MGNSDLNNGWIVGKDDLTRCQIVRCFAMSRLDKEMAVRKQRGSNTIKKHIKNELMLYQAYVNG
jgi:hypothetical protein